MKKLKYIIPIAILLLVPWTHKVLYENVLLAWPDADHSSVHWGVVIASVVVAWFSGLYFSLGS